MKNSKLINLLNYKGHDIIIVGDYHDRKKN